MTVNQMVNWLDRETIAAARERRMRRQLRKLPPRLRKFCLSVKRVMLVERGPEIYIREKVCSANKIGIREYQKLLQKVRETLP